MQVHMMMGLAMWVVLDFYGPDQRLLVKIDASATSSEYSNSVLLDQCSEVPLCSLQTRV